MTDNVWHEDKREYNRVAAKLHGTIVNVRRRTEDGGLDRARGRRFVSLLVESGRYEFCSRCSQLLPANGESFRTDNSKVRGWTQPCRRCDAELRGLRRLRKVTRRPFLERRLAQRDRERGE